MTCTVVTRLKKSHQEESTLLFAQGHATGERWAREDATARELRRLAAFCRDGDANHTEIISPLVASDSIYTRALDRFVEIIRPADSCDCGCDEFWDEVIGEDGDTESLHDPAYANGFAKGALDVWLSVAAEVMG